MDVLLLFVPILITFAFGFLFRVTGYLSQDVCERLIEYLMKVPIPIATFYALTKIEPSMLSSMHYFIFIYVILNCAFLGGGFLIHLDEVSADWNSLLNFTCVNSGFTVFSKSLSNFTTAAERVKNDWVF